MAGEERAVYVYDDFSCGEPILLGTLYNSISLDLAIRTAPRFNVSVQAAGRIVGEITAVIRENWERLAKEYGLSHSQIEYMRPAFGECYRE